jgi:hypothetical protein
MVIHRTSHLGCLYFGSLVVLLVYSILYGLTAQKARWLGGITSITVVVLGKLSLVHCVANSLSSQHVP